ncbi:MAG: hypothetical protein L0196_06385 [candidate division Zixibacteria bacterium]|nr:hypothetical protein [candidate division Zixibacteria bacterium]
MLVWCAVLFVLGVLAFMDSLFNYGEIFRQVNSVLFMLVSLGLLIRTTTKIKLRTVEGYMERIKQLEDELLTLRHPGHGKTTRRESVSS